MAAWQGAQHIAFGPVALFERHARFEFWPDPRNVASRQLSQLFQKRAPAAITPRSFGIGSVAVQGLGALERVLFDAEGAKKLASDDYRCAWLRAAAANVATMARDTEAEWREYGPRFASDAPGGVHAWPRDASLELFKSLHASVELVADRKLAKPLGDSADKARPLLAESWRSGSSIDNAEANLAAGLSLYDALSPGVADPALDEDLRKRFATVIEEAKAIDGELKEAVSDPRRRPEVERLQQDTAALKAAIANRLSAALDLPLGFKALDGD
jgi:predicted lipoprotein